MDFLTRKRSPSVNSDDRKNILSDTSRALSPRIPVSLVFLVLDLDSRIYKYATWSSCRKFETNLVHDRSVFILFLKGIKSFNRLLLRPKV